MVVFDGQAIVVGNGFETVFAFEGGSGVSGILTIVEDVATGMVNKECATCVSVLLPAI